MASLGLQPVVAHPQGEGRDEKDNARFSSNPNQPTAVSRFISSPPTRETRSLGMVSGSSTRKAVAGYRRMIAKPRASSSSPPTREMQWRNALSRSATRKAVAGYRRTIARPNVSSSSPPTRETRRQRRLLEDAADSNSTRTSPHYRHGWVPLRKGTQRDMSAGYSIGKIKIPHSGNMRHRLWTST